MNKIDPVPPANLTSLMDEFDDPFLGFNLQFIEIEVLRLIYYYKLEDITEIFLTIEQKYPLNNISKSQFYRIIEKLEKNQYISAKKEGKSKILTFMEKGKKELYFFIKYMYGFMSDQIFSEEALQEIIDMTTESLGCLRQFKMMALGPYTINLSSLLEKCLNCENPMNIEGDKISKPIFIVLPDSDKSLVEIEDNIQILESEKPYDLLPKDGSVDLIFESLVFSRWPDKMDESLQEINRILKPGGLAFIFEPTKNVSNMVIDIMNKLLVGISEELKPWTITKKNKDLESVEYYTNSLEKYFDQIVVRSELALTLFIARKKI